ncbi:hypothetical protein GCM10027168_04920 [Streptomyces capparidis]
MRKVGYAFGIAAVVLASATVMPSTANAAPTGCTVTNRWSTPAGAASHCTSGSGYHRVVIACGSSPDSQVWYLHYGAWASAGESSSKVCPSTTPYMDPNGPGGTIQKR